MSLEGYCDPLYDKMLFKATPRNSFVDHRLLVPNILNMAFQRRSWPACPYAAQRMGPPHLSWCPILWSKT